MIKIILELRIQKVIKEKYMLVISFHVSRIILLTNWKYISNKINKLKK